MSHVTDLVFTITGCHYIHGMTPATFRQQFEDVFEELHGWSPKPVETSPTPDKGWSADVYLIGVNYLDLDLPEKLAELSWPAGTTLWLHNEQDDDTGVRIHRYGESTAMYRETT